MAKLTNKEREEMKNLINTGATQTVVAKRFNVTQSAVSRVVRGRKKEA